ncbi:MAG TPA: EamA family transporter, partial [Nocardioides sp.]
MTADATDRDHPDRRASLLATGALLLMTACWGSTFFLIHDLTDRVDPVDFLAIRFPIATVSLFLIFPRALRRLSPLARRRSVVLGAVYASA